MPAIAKLEQRDGNAAGGLARRAVDDNAIHGGKGRGGKQ